MNIFLLHLRSINENARLIPSNGMRYFGKHSPF